MRVALIGCGFIGRRHLGNLLDADDVVVAAVADRDRRRAREAAELARAPCYQDEAAVLAGEELDAVWICVPPFAHGPLERAAVDRGLPFFVEKPLAADRATAEDIADTVAAAGLVTSVGYHWRYLDTVEAARTLLAGNPPRLALGSWLDATPPPAWWRAARGSGGQMVEQATHLFDLARVLLGEPTSVFAAGCRCERVAWPPADIDEVSTATLQFGGSSVATISATCLLDHPHRIGLELIADGLAVGLSETAMTVARDGEVQTASAAVDPFVLEDSAFLQAVVGAPGAVRADYGEALRTHRLVAAAVRSARDGTPIDLTGAGVD